MYVYIIYIKSKKEEWFSLANLIRKMLIIGKRFNIDYFPIVNPLYYPVFYTITVLRTNAFRCPATPVECLFSPWDVLSHRSYVDSAKATMRPPMSFVRVIAAISFVQDETSFRNLAACRNVTDIIASTHNKRKLKLKRNVIIVVLQFLSLLSTLSCILSYYDLTKNTIQ